MSVYLHPIGRNREEKLRRCGGSSARHVARVGRVKGALLAGCRLGIARYRVGKGILPFQQKDIDTAIEAHRVGSYDEHPQHRQPEDLMPFVSIDMYMVRAG